MVFDYLDVKGICRLCNEWQDTHASEKDLGHLESFSLGTSHLLRGQLVALRKTTATLFIL